MLFRPALVSVNCQSPPLGLVQIGFHTTGGVRLVAAYNRLLMFVVLVRLSVTLPLVLHTR